MTAEPAPASARPDPGAIIELDPVLRAYERRHPRGSTDLIYRAYDVAGRYHEGQFRKSGEPFISHPLTVAQILAEYGMDEATLAAAILHDTVEDTDLTLDVVTESFGAEVAELIDGVTKLDRIQFNSREEQQAASIRKLMIAVARDVRVLLIKLADRLHNVRTLWALPEDKQRRIAVESIEVYAPLAHRLGVQEIKHEIEDSCFAVVYPRRSREIAELMERRAPQRDAYIEKSIREVEDALEAAEINAAVTGRPKHPYSIYRKMMDTGLPFEAIHDLIGIRVITADVRDCYAALGVIHTLWPPVQGRFKDYVAMPKFNLYQSLHTTVLGLDGKPLEVQIRTQDMHERAEAGIAAHWRYKEGVGPDDLPWMADMRFLQDEYADPAEFLARLRIDLYQDEVFAVTPKGDVVTLPAGATPVDFAYKIHTEVGHRCVGAKVNSRLVPLSTELRSGDIVEISTSKAPSAGPSRDWLTFVKTSRSQAKIRQWFSRERRETALAEGRDQVAKLVRKEGLGLSAVDRDRAYADIARSMGYNDLEAMFVAVGEGNVAAATVAGRLVRQVRPEMEPEHDQDLLRPPVRRRRPSRGIIVEGLEDVKAQIARCCAPVPGDPIVGFVTVGRGVSVHRADCTNIGALSDKPERMIDVAWDPTQVGSYTAWIQVEALDRPKLLKDVTSILSDQGANIAASSSGTDRDRVAVLRYEVELSDAEQLRRVIGELRGVEGVFDVYRLVPGQDD